MTQPPAGWHPDPQNPNLLRYWDGQQWTGHTQPRPQQGPPVKKSNRSGWKVVGVLVAAFVALSVIVSIFGGDGDNAPAPKTAAELQEERAQDARIAERTARTNAELLCEEAVSKRLKSPSTADFPEEHNTRPFEDGYEVRGFVDSQNGFGATVRSVFGCTVVPATLGKYTVTVTELADY